ncbi:MAG: ATP-binding cassette domain-containing protein [Spirochaetes bacterium]|nr:ATP-binding cassette domain-containing protein [Spirochaetota bacterium]
MVLNGVSLSLEKGETFVIIGMSGTGKTVTIRHIAGLVMPDRGQVIIDGVDMTKSSPRERARIRSTMGVVFQSGALINWLTVEENVALPLVERRAHSRQEIADIVHEKLRLLQLLDAKDKMPSDISGGMKKRVCLARVLVRNPAIILYDEPTSGLDPIMSSLISELIVKMKHQFQVTSVVVSHDMGSAFAIADRIAVLYEGKIVECDRPARIRNSDNPIVQQFIHGEIHGPIKVD